MFSCAAMYWQLVTTKSGTKHPRSQYYVKGQHAFIKFCCKTSKFLFYTLLVIVRLGDLDKVCVKMKRKKGKPKLKENLIGIKRKLWKKIYKVSYMSAQMVPVISSLRIIQSIWVNYKSMCHFESYLIIVVVVSHPLNW